MSLSMIDPADTGDCTPATNMYEAFINHLQAQSSKNVSSFAAEILTGDAQYLITHCGIEADAAATASDAGGNTRQSRSYEATHHGALGFWRQ